MRKKYPYNAPPPEPRRVKNPVVFQPRTYAALQRGANRLADAIRPTLGPSPRFVALDRGLSNEAPEIFDSGGLIARRVVALPNRDEDMGAMLLRGLLWRLHERWGDGTATAATLFQSVFNQGISHVVGGGDPMRLRQALDAHLPVILDHLDTLVTPLRGKAALAHMAASVCHDAALARLLGEVFDAIGEYGQLELRDGNSRDLEREYIEGCYWEGGLLDREMISDRTKLKTVLENPAIVISDVPIDHVEQLEAAVSAALATGAENIVLLTTQISGEALAALRQRALTSKTPKIVPIKTPGTTIEVQMGSLEDLGLMTGGQPLLRAPGQTWAELRPEMLGRARLAWADRYSFGVVGGRGNPRALRQHVRQLRTTFANATDKGVREVLQQRLGRLLGGAATVSIGANTTAEMKVRKESAERTAATLRGALLEGALPGGGAALLACRVPLRQRLRTASDPDERAALRILIEALAAPMTSIVANAGDEPSTVLAAAERAGPPHGYDVLTHQVVNMTEAGILDVAPVLKAAVKGAVSTAALGLTIDVLIHLRKPLPQLTPR